MKLRDFVANSLPRVRGRKKKGQTVNGTATSITAVAIAAVASTATVSPVKQCTTDILASKSSKSQRRQSGNIGSSWLQFGESKLSFLERLVGKESPVKRLFETKERPGVTSRKSEEHVCPDIKEDAVVPTSDGSRPYGSVEVIGAFRDRPLCQYSAPVSPACAAYPHKGQGGDLDCESLYAGCQGYADSVSSCDVPSYHSTPGSKRGPRSRSRIRTNPWLPSPRPSPYSVRSFSSPCTSSRSASPSSSPAPPSSSENTSPLTSHSSDASASHQPQLHRLRRHRRYHSEVNASDLSRTFVFEAPLTDTEQYYSTLDSGIGEAAVCCPLEKDKHKAGNSRRHRALSTKRRNSERESELLSHLKGYSFATSSSSSSPKLKAKTRPKNKPSLSNSSKGVVVNRDSKFWDSDSSRSPPTLSKIFGLKRNKSPSQAIRKDLDKLWDGIVGSELEKVGARPFLSEAVVALDLTLASLEDESFELSPCEDICVITSNIEQLAQNISSEYEEGPDTSFESAAGSEKPRNRCSILENLLNFDSEKRITLPRRDSHPRSDLDYQSFAEPLQSGEAAKEERERIKENPPDNNRTGNQGTSSSLKENMPTADVAVQTDFDDDDEDNSVSDWLASTESGSDWVASNGSGSDWPTSNGSGCDWLTGEGSVCPTDEDRVEEGGTEVHPETSNMEENGKFWITPDIMQDSTDTGYSSLSRDGRIVTDSENSNSSTSPGKNSDDSSDSANVSDEKTFSAVSNKPTIPSYSNPEEGSSHCEGTVSQTGRQSKESVEYDCVRELKQTAKPISCTPGCTKGSNADKPLLLNEKEHLLDQSSEYCSCDASFSKIPPSTEKRLAPFLAPSKARHEHRKDRDNIVPYPYDVTRFSGLPLLRELKPSNFSSRYPARFLPRSDWLSAFEKRSTTKPDAQAAAGISAAANGQKSANENFYSCTGKTSKSGNQSTVKPESWSRRKFGEEASFAPFPPVKSSSTHVAEEPLHLVKPLTTGRTLDEVKVSLEDKVSLLRRGRHVVNRKIREARQEELLRQQQKLRFQRLLGIHRKQILLDTLQDLRQRLQNQSDRLQASYSAVLDIQKRCT